MPLFRRLPTLASRAALVAAITGAACGDDEAPESPRTNETAAVPEPAIVPLDDIRAPDFDGVSRVELIGLERFTISWEPATDETSAQEALEYQIFHIVEPYATLNEDTEPIYTSQPGATSVTVAVTGDPGRFFVRAVDEAGNPSGLTPGLMQHTRRPLVRATDRTLAAAITDCVQHPTGPICVGEEGFAAQWSGTRWERFDLGVIANLRITETPGGVFAYSELGHLYAFDDTGKPALVELQFPLRAPILPFRQFTADAVGLRYWIDDSGRTFVGADHAFVPMTRPIAVPGDACRRLRGLAFSPAANVALCEGDAVYSQNATDPTAPWYSLTPNAQFPLPQGVSSMMADDDTDVIIVDPTGVRGLGVGGTHAMLLTDWNQSGVHPMDVPDNPPALTSIRAAFFVDDTLHVAADTGLFQRADTEWTRVEAVPGPLASGIATDDGVLLLYPEGGVARWKNERLRWERAQDVSGFEEAWIANDGTLVASVGEALYAWDTDHWRALDARRPGGTLQGFTGSWDDTATFYGDSDGMGAIWERSRGAFRPVSWRFAPPPPPPRDDDDTAALDPVEDNAMVFGDDDGLVAPPSPIASVSAADATDPPSPEPILFVDRAADGRGVAVSAHQVWWRVAEGWRLMAVHDETLSGAFLDVDESYVLIRDGQAVRCWRDDCDTTTQLSDGPLEIARSIRSAGPTTVVTPTGQLFAFQPATPVTEPLVDPATELPVGAWESMGSLSPHTDAIAFAPGEPAALLTPTGELYERRAAGWELQGELNDVLTLLAVEDGWAMLTARGLFQLGSVRPAVRETSTP